jgi:hypothetical protein
MDCSESNTPKTSGLNHRRWKLALKSDVPRQQKRVAPVEHTKMAYYAFSGRGAAGPVGARRYDVRDTIMESKESSPPFRRSGRANRESIAAGCCRA